MKVKDFELTAPKSLTEVVIDKIRQMIVDGAVEFGQQITENELSEQFKISKTPIREALIQLSSERLVEIKPRSGTFIFSLTEKEIDDISFLRISLEQAAIRSSMAKDGKIRMLAELARNINESGPLIEKHKLSHYLKLDAAFHKTFMDYADNPYLVSAHKPISVKILAMRNRVAFSHNFVINSIAEHAAMLDALMTDNITLACDLLEKHINNGFSIQAKRHLCSDD